MFVSQYSHIRFQPYRLPDLLFPFLLFSYYPNRQIGKLFYCCLNLSSSESPEDEGGRGWCSMCSYILAHFKNRAVFNTKFFHGSEYLGCWYFKISLSALISKYQCGLVYLNYLVFLIGVTAICLDRLPSGRSVSVRRKGKQSCL